MVFDTKSNKHKIMRELLKELNVDNPERDNFYSTGSTVTEAALSTALDSLKKYKSYII